MLVNEVSRASAPALDTEAVGAVLPIFYNATQRCRSKRRAATRHANRLRYLRSTVGAAERAAHSCAPGVGPATTRKHAMAASGAASAPVPRTDGARSVHPLRRATPSKTSLTRASEGEIPAQSLLHGEASRKSATRLLRQARGVAPGFPECQMSTAAIQAPAGAGKAPMEPSWVTSFAILTGCYNDASFTVMFAALPRAVFVSGQWLLASIAQQGLQDINFDIFNLRCSIQYKTTHHCGYLHGSRSKPIHVC